MNPTIVGGFGVHDLSQILPRHQFSQLIEERVHAIPATDRLHETLQHTLKQNFQFYSVKRDSDCVHPLQNNKGVDELDEISEDAYTNLTDTGFSDPSLDWWGINYNDKPDAGA